MYNVLSDTVYCTCNYVFKINYKTGLSVIINNDFICTYIFITTSTLITLKSTSYCSEV